MITYGICVGSKEKYLRVASRSMARCLETDNLVVEVFDSTSIFEAYNYILDSCKDREDLEALVLIHEDVELRDDTLPGTVRKLFADESIAIAGVIGGSNIPGLAWWEGERKGRTTDAPHGELDFGRGQHDVDTVDGLLLILSPWAVRNLRFDETNYTGFHGFDADICFQARAAGKRVVTVDIDLFHDTKGGYGDFESWKIADATFKHKWLENKEN